MKAQRLPRSVKKRGRLPVGPGIRSIMLVPALVPSLIIGSEPWVELNTLLANHSEDPATARSSASIWVPTANGSTTWIVPGGVPSVRKMPSPAAK